MSSQVPADDGFDVATMFSDRARNARRLPVPTIPWLWVGQLALACVAGAAVWTGLQMSGTLPAGPGRLVASAVGFATSLLAWRLVGPLAAAAMTLVVSAAAFGAAFLTTFAPAIIATVALVVLGARAVRRNRKDGEG